VELVNSDQSPCASEDGHYEEGEEAVRHLLVVVDIWVDEPAQHTDDGNGDDDLEDPDASEEN